MGGSTGGSSSPATALADQARQAKEQAARAAGDALQQAKSTAQQTTQQVGQQAAEAARMLRERGTSMLSDQKTRAASTLEGFGSAIHAAGDRLAGDHDNALAGYVHGAADQVSVLANYLKDQPVESLVTDLRDMARRRPEYFVGGMFLAGLALARFAKSATLSTPSRGSSRMGGDVSGRPGAGYPDRTYGDVGSRSGMATPGRDQSTYGQEPASPYPVPDANVGAAAGIPGTGTGTGSLGIDMPSAGTGGTSSFGGTGSTVANPTGGQSRPLGL